MKKMFTKFGGGKIALLFMLVLLLASNVYVCKKSGYWKRILAKMHIRELKKEDAPDYWAVRGWTTCLEKMRTKCDICFFGHSQIEMSDFQKDFPKKKIIELGYPGDDIDGMIKRAKQVTYVHPNKIFLLAGTNSLYYAKENFELKYKQLINLIRKENPKAQLYILSILPQRDGKLGKSSLNSVIEERNLFIKSFCKNEDIIFIDIFSLYTDENGELKKEFTFDGVHLKEECYNKISNVIRKYI